MKLTHKIMSFFFPIFIVILICISITLYCVEVGEAWMHDILDDHLFFIQASQIVCALITGLVLRRINFTRKNGLWYIIPLILIIFAFLYSPVLETIYPCC